MQIKLNLLYFARRINHETYKFENTKLKKAQMKYLGVILDNEVNYQIEVKNLLSKMAQAFKYLYNLRECLPKNLLPVKISSLVICHLQYPAVLLITVDNSLRVTLENI